MSDNFLVAAISSDLSNRGGAIATRFPPEPNGYLHIGHAKSICINFGLAERFDGTCNLRYDDTNPAKEDDEYVHSILQDVRWLGFEPAQILYASDYFDQLLKWANQLIEQGDAYVCDLTAEQTRQMRGTITSPGQNSPGRDRSAEENRDLFARMVGGEFDTGAKTLRAKIDMAADNLNLRDPVMYRIANVPHDRTGDKYCVYPMYDWAHGQSDSIEGITHSICTLEFEQHRPLYDWFCERLGIHHPRQIEFARLNLSYTVMSKRKLLQLVEAGHVDGWDDPRMPTISGLRRRGYTPSSIRSFVTETGVSKYNGVVDVVRLENAIREELNATADRKMVVCDPLKLTLTNWPAGEVEMVTATNNPEDESAGTREIPISGSLWIEREDFREEANRKFFRLKKGGAVRLRAGFIVDCHDCIKDESGEVIEVLATVDFDTRSGADESGRKVKGTIHWVSRDHGVPVTVRNYDRLFQTESPEKAEGTATFLDDLNPDSLSVQNGIAEPSVAELSPGDRVQFERLGYYVVDTDSTAEAIVFNRTVGLRDSWKDR